MKVKVPTSAMLKSTSKTIPMPLLSYNIHLRVVPSGFRRLVSLMGQTQLWRRVEVERQEAREEEAAAILRQCQEEGGCGAKEIDPEGILTGKTGY
jgi:hypothetical protein